MKRTLTTIATAVLVMTVSAQKLTVNVSDIRSNQGHIMIGVGFTINGSWDPVVTEDNKTVNFKIVYLNSKK